MRSRIVAALGALACVAALVGTAAAQRRGEPVRGADELALGPDVPVVVGAPAGPPVTGQALEERSWALDLGIRCPVCQGQAIAESPAESAKHMKRQVRAMVAAGYSDDQVMSYLEHSYGEFIRLRPRAEGLNLLVWALPLTALALGTLIAVVVMRRRGRLTPPAPGAAAATATRPPAVDPALAPWLAQVRRETEGDDAPHNGR
ncbi:MAG: cytochrome c-type biogenesis protein CcmH [Deltaproteobacteria bacterium]|nr:cytochrome c-type biogenesis protein CcmH [Deltaproteobacteria bacterium]